MTIINDRGQRPVGQHIFRPTDIDKAVHHLHTYSIPVCSWNQEVE
jgi:hypothetical protein